MAQIYGKRQIVSIQVVRNLSTYPPTQIISDVIVNMTSDVVVETKKIVSMTDDLMIHAEIVDLYARVSNMGGLIGLPWFVQSEG